VETNVLYYGDNLEILRKYIPDRSIDLIYLDPPFNSKATYNVLYKEQTGEPSQAQITAFEDTWHWGLESEKALQDIFASPIAPSAVKDFMSVMPKFLGKKTDMAAYLVMMCVRLLELRRVLKDIGSIYLHCDPTASHYLKVVMDAIFGVNNFRNEIVWQRTNAHNMKVRGYVRTNDALLFYTRSDEFTYNEQYTVYSPQQLRRYKPDEKGRLYTGQDLTFSTVNPNRQFKWRGATPAPNRSWGASYEQLEEWYGQGRILLKKDGTPRLDGLKVYLDETKGIPLSTNWTDIPRVRNTASERLGYPTQKPEALLERIVKASSNEGDIVLDPFCGCGTALVMAQKLNRRWIGIDVTHLAISTMKWRLEKMFPNIQYKVVGEPRDLESAKELANQNKYQFQWWAVSLVGGQPYGDKKKGADTGIDGYLYFMDEKDKVKRGIIQVKAGAASVSQIRDLVGVIQREKAEMGVFLCLESATKPMQMEADSQGFYHSPLGKDYPKIQIFTIEQVVVEGRKPDIPPWIAPVDTPPTAKKVEGKTIKML
jgi:site-specific DNA-methyltransferase (adenine-specific)